MIQRTDRQALHDWEEFCRAVRASVPVRHETETAKAERMGRQALPGNEEEWFSEYFPQYCFSAPAPFHTASSRTFLQGPRIFQCRAWARGLAKTTRRMMEVFYRMFAQGQRINCLLISKTGENAVRLLAPYRAALEANPRLLADYGLQEWPGKWKETEFTTRRGDTFRAVGKGQNPRGAKNGELRINLVIFDDADDDEECRNPGRLQQSWEWVQGAVIPAVDISRPYWICFDNNIIAEDCLALRAQAFATHVEKVNIRDGTGRTVWQKNTEADIDFMLARISYEAGQKEYFNNPMSAGNAFSSIKWDKCPPLKDLPFVVQYADPATSDRAAAGGSCKAVVIVGLHGENYYIYKAFVDNMNNSSFIDCLYAGRSYVGGGTQLYTFIENNTLQNPFYEQVLLPLVAAAAQEHGSPLLITPDKRRKPEKWFRIEGCLEPLNRLGRMVFNIDERDDPHMQRLAAQFRAARPGSKMLDGPDSVEGAVYIIGARSRAFNASDVYFSPNSRYGSKHF